MPKLVRKTGSVKPRTGFGSYAGAVPRPGTYPARIISLALRTYKTGTKAINVGWVIDAPEGSRHAEFNGYPNFASIFLGESDAQLEREAAFYVAVAGTQDPPGGFVYEETKTKVGNSTDQKITKVGEVQVVNSAGRLVEIHVLADLRREKEEYNGERQLRGDTIYADPSHQVAGAGEVAEGDPDAEEDSTPEEPVIKTNTPAPTATVQAEVDGDTVVAEVEPGADYHAMILPDLKKYAASKGIDTTVVKTKQAIYDALDAQVAGSGATVDEPTNVTEANSMAEEAFTDWAGRQYGGADQLEGMTREQIVAMLVEDELLTAF